MTPKASAAPPRASRKPVLTSSKMQQRPELRAQIADALQEALTRQDALRVAEHRLDQDAGDLIALALEEAAQRGQVVVGHRDDRLADGLGDAAAPGQADGIVAIAELGDVVGQHADQGVVVHAVVLAFELHDLVAPGEGARHADGVHGRVGAGGGHAGHVAERELADQLGRGDLVLAGEAEADAAAHALVDVVVHAGVAVAEDHRAVAHAQVHELVAVQVPDQPALATVDVDGVLVPGAEVGVRAAGQGLQGSPVELQLARPRQFAAAAERGHHGLPSAKFVAVGLPQLQISALHRAAYDPK